MSESFDEFYAEESHLAVKREPTTYDDYAMTGRAIRVDDYVDVVSPLEVDTNVMWSARVNEPPFAGKMDDDDIFQVDKSDLIQDSNLSTLSDLNPNRDLLDDLNFDDLMMPGDFGLLPHRSSPGPHQLPNTPANSYDSSYSPFLTTGSDLGFYKDSLLETAHSVPSSPLNIVTCNTKTYLTLDGVQSPTMLSPTAVQPKPSPLHELLLKREPFSLTKPFGRAASRLSSSAPTQGLDQMWQRREPRQHLLSTGSLVEAGSTSSLSTGGILSPDACDYSLDETCDSEDDSEQDYDFSSDNESGSDGEGTPSSKASKKERYFWQYNVQSKGPKGQRLVLKTQQEDPHCLHEVTDPVFSADCSLQGIKHSGKARKGDGNDLTPNPRKLHSIGKELDKLNRVINDMTPVSELPFNVRPNTRKEKNKLASRACRLKKKAQHEANKIKLLGLEQEHKRLLNCINHFKLMLAARVAPASVETTESLKNVDKMAKQATKFKVAGQTTEFVNKVLEKSRSGVPGGGLDDLGSFH